MTTLILLNDITNLDPTVATVYVTGWINGGIGSFQVLQSDGTFGGSSPTSVPFYPVSSIPVVTLDTATAGNNQLLFVISPASTGQPAALTVQSLAPVKYTQYPYFTAGGVLAPGPFDIFEFGLDAQADVSAVSGFGLNLRFAVNIGAIPGGAVEYGVVNYVTRQQIGAAYAQFIAREAGVQPAAKAFAELLYDQPIFNGAPTPPNVDGQFFAISDPNDMLGALTQNYVQSTTDPLATYWDDILTSFFAAGNYLSINLSQGTPNIYSGQCVSTSTGTAYTLSNGQNTYTFPNPLNSDLNTFGFAGGQYTFQQAFGPYTPSGSANDAGLLQDNIWMALCRGVALDGVSTSPISNGETTYFWNNWAKWYQAGTICHYYAKFLHYADIDGGDSRLSGKPSIFANSAAYGFSEDENPDGPYSGPNVPAKTLQNVPDGTNIVVFVGAWSTTIPA